MIKPVQQDDVFLADVLSASHPDHFFLWWLGQSGFLIKWNQHYLLIDPYLSDSLTAKYAATDKPHVRMTERVIAPERLAFVDLVTSSHNHTDHLDAATLLPLIRANPKLELIIPEANRVFVAERLQIKLEQPLGLDDHKSIMRHGFTVTGVPAAHEQLQRDEQGRHRFLGYVIQCGPWTLYHSGDTLLYDGMAERLRQWKIDLALLPINGRVPERRVDGNLDGAQAVQLAFDIGARLVIPCHYEMFEFNTATPDLLVSTAQQLDQPYRILQAGERWSSAELPCDPEC